MTEDQTNALASGVMADTAPAVTAYHAEAADWARKARLRPDPFYYGAEANALLATVYAYELVHKLQPLTTAERLRVAARVAERAND